MVGLDKFYRGNGWMYKHRLCSCPAPKLEDSHVVRQKQPHFAPSMWSDYGVRLGLIRQDQDSRENCVAQAWLAWLLLSPTGGPTKPMRGRVIFQMATNFEEHLMGFARKCIYKQAPMLFVELISSSSKESIRYLATGALPATDPRCFPCGGARS